MREKLAKHVKGVREENKDKLREHLS